MMTLQYISLMNTHFNTPTLTILYYKTNTKRCRDGNVCEAYVILFLFGNFSRFAIPTLMYISFLCDEE